MWHLTLKKKVGKFALEVGIRRVAACDCDVVKWWKNYLKLEGKS